MPISWRFKVIQQSQNWVQIPDRYQDLQRVAYALYQSILKEGKASGDKRLPGRWMALMAGSGQDWPYHILSSVKRLATKWPPLGTKMPDGEPIAEVILRNLEWMRNEFAIPLVESAGGTKEEAYPLIGDIMISYLRALGDVLQEYLRDEQIFVWES